MKKTILLGCIGCFLASICSFTSARASETATLEIPATTESKTSESVSDESSMQDKPNTQMTLSQFKDTIGQESELYGSLSKSDVFSLMKESLNQGESISLEDAMNISGGLTIPSNMMYDLSESGLTGKIDTSVLNIQYGGFVSQMAQDYNSMDLSSKSQGAVSIFQSQYGNISDFTLEEASLPEGWTMQDMINNNTGIINSAYNTAYNSGNFASIRNSVDVSGIFGQAANGAVAYNLKSNGELNSQVKQLASNYKADAERKRTDSKRESQVLASQNFASISSTKDYVDSFTIDENGNLKTPYDSKIQQAVNETSHNNKRETANEHPFTSSLFDYSSDGYASEVDGDSNTMSQLTSGYLFQEWLDTFTGNGFADSGESISVPEYIVTGQIGEDIYDSLHPDQSKKKWGLNVSLPN